MRLGEPTKLEQNTNVHPRQSDAGDVTGSVDIPDRRVIVLVDYQPADFVAFASELATEVV